ncbi:putative uncharacterized protein [Escherichia coli chi7122]|nr:putative uncharacterized protein [Escherichia coli]CCK46685.1 putative uncharacterized protein [Escherichia coli chi7122]
MRTIIFDLLMMILLVIVHFLIRANTDVVENQPGKSGNKASRCQRFQRAFPQAYRGVDLRIFRQTVIQLRLIGVMQHVHNVRTTDPFRVVDASMFVTTRFQFRHALFRQLQHLLLGAEVDSPGRTGFHTSRFLADADAIDAERAFIYPVILFVEARNIKRTPGNAVTTADAVFRLEIDNPVSVLNDCTSRRARLQAAGIFTVHTAVFTDQPLQLAVLFGFAKAHHRPGLGAQIGGVIVNPDAVPHFITDVVPLRTRHLTGFTADTGGNVDKFCDFCFVITHLRRRRDGVSCGPFDNVLRFHSHLFAPLRLLDVD